MSQLANVWVFSDNVERYAELMTGARQYGKRVYAIVQGSAHVGRVKALGADEIIILESHTDLQRVENYAETLASLLGDNNGLLLMAATRRCKALGARLSIQLNAVMVNDATSIELINGTLCAEHRMYGGLAFGK
ncbi:electron transfer flavoprotein subunit alpha, partial [Salmonella enterica]|nr:electron transfer flavoprotein subunit alpha [Salmonella enterica]EEJ4409641.1 electron transfer flavoprotein subunit alpha [Salmonella enterica]EGF0724613.1 electron transfer flavoprotein subunit alpha [Salmonella enterica]EJB9339568.1 electron transfer flavoprotein subunit alpha [Salmonella enterica]